MSAFSRASVLVRSRSRAVVACAALVVVASAAACGGIGITSADGNSFEGDAAVLSGNAAAALADSGPVDGGVTTSGEAGATVAPADSADIASLCGDTSACAPDESSANGCNGTSASDAGATPGTSGDDGGAASACRVKVISASSTAAICTIAGSGVDGVACTTGSDCASGFDCVGTPGVCRRYCCNDTCTAGSSFCDVQPVTGQSTGGVADVALTIPACVPIAPCKLLMPSACSTGETCGVVADDGTTSCLAIGVAAEGDACNSVHCGDNLVCLGQKGSRRCEKLCHIGGTDCASPQVCTGNAQEFTDSTIGVCQ